MKPHFTFSQLTFLIAAAVALGAVVILIVYALHRAIQRQRAEGELKSAAPRAGGDAAFVLATTQGVIADLKKQQKETQELYRAAARRADEYAQRLEAIAQEIGEGLLVFDREGFVSLTNSAARTLLEIDTWSRRKYPEVLGPESPLTHLIRACFQTGTTTRPERIAHRTERGEARFLLVSVRALRARSGDINGVVCLLRAGAEAPPSRFPTLTL